MTCIVGIEADERVIIGGDSAGVGGYSLTVRADSKVFRRGAYAFGFTTSFRMGQLLRYAGTLTDPNTWDVDCFMVERFVPEVRTILRDGGWLHTSNGVEQGGVFLVGVASRLYTVFSDFQIARSTCGYAAVGCGDDLALGALHATEGVTSAPDRVNKALAAAATHSAGVVEPFHLVTT